MSESKIAKTNLSTPDVNRNLSYPSNGNNICFQVEDHSYWFKHRNELIYQIIRSSFSKDVLSKMRFLDLGGGNGFVTKMLQDHGFDIILVEPGAGAINAKIRGVRKIFHGNLEEYPCSEKFDVICMFDVLEHIPDTLTFLNNASASLYSNGKMIFTVPCYNFLFSLEDEIAGHQKRYTLKSLRSELRAAGMEIEMYTYFFAALIIPIFLFRTLPYLLGRRSYSQRDTSKDLVLGSFTDVFLNWFFRLERNFIKKVMRLPFGASLIVVARKKESLF